MCFSSSDLRELLGLHESSMKLLPQDRRRNMFHGWADYPKNPPPLFLADHSMNELFHLSKEMCDVHVPMEGGDLTF